VSKARVYGANRQSIPNNKRKDKHGGNPVFRSWERDKARLAKIAEKWEKECKVMSYEEVGGKEITQAKQRLMMEVAHEKNEN